MKKILFITPFAPSNIGAAMKFTKKTIETLSQDYIIHLVYFIAEGEQQYTPLHPNIHLLKSYKVTTSDRICSILQKPWLFPIFSVRYRRELEKDIKSWTQQYNYDLLFLDHSQSFIYGKQFPNIQKILMSHDVIYQRISRTSGKLMSLWCNRTERSLITQSKAHVFSFSIKDKAILDKEYGIQSYVTCGNIDDIAHKTFPTKKTDTFIFFGQWVRKDNSEGLEWFLREVYHKTPESMHFKIIGRGISQQLLAQISSMDRVEYCGFVDNPYQEIANSRAVLSPLFSGAGVKFKVLESIACGTPVIGSEIAFEGIPTEFEQFMLLANTPDEYISLMNSINYSVDQCIAMKQKFLSEYINPYIIKHINELLK